MARLLLIGAPSHRAPALVAVAIAAAAAAAGAAGCDAGGPRFCSVTCGAAGECPGGTTCGPDLYCYAPDDVPGSCAQAGQPDGGDGGDGTGGDIGDGAGDGTDGAGDGTDGAGDGTGGDGTGSCDPCDPVEQCGCAQGDGCYAGGDTSGPSCAPAGALGEEGLCSTDPECSAGLGCAVEDNLGGHCQKYCNEDADCGGGLRLCNRAVPGSEVRACTSDCDPLDTAACGATEKCTLDRGQDERYDARCLQHGGGGFLDVCLDQTDCGPGLICIDNGVDGDCEFLCTIGGTDCGADVTCLGFTTPVVFGGVEYGSCLF